MHLGHFVMVLVLQSFTTSFEAQNGFQIEARQNTHAHMTVTAFKSITINNHLMYIYVHRSGPYTNNCIPPLITILASSVLLLKDGKLNICVMIGLASSRSDPHCCLSEGSKCVHWSGASIIPRVREHKREGSMQCETESPIESSINKVFGLFFM